MPDRILSVDDIRLLHGGGALSTADDLTGLPRAKEVHSDVCPGIADNVVANLPIASDADSMDDYSADVAELATSPDLIWSSTDPKNFIKNGKINFLHLNKDGKFILTILKPGTKTVLSATIEKNYIDAARAKITGMKDWDKSKSTENWMMPGGDIDGNTYIFNRFLDLGFGLKLHWVGQHKNKGTKVVVNDKFTIEKGVHEAHAGEA